MSWLEEISKQEYNIILKNMLMQELFQLVFIKKQRKVGNIFKNYDRAKTEAFRI